MSGTGLCHATRVNRDHPTSGQRFPKNDRRPCLPPEPPQNGDCYQFLPLELDSCPRFAPGCHSCLANPTERGVQSASHGQNRSPS